MSEISRRRALGALAGATAAAACSRKAEPRAGSEVETRNSAVEPAIESEPMVRQVFPLTRGRPWPTPDPFLFCAHHNDRYPKGRANFGPDASLGGRNLGQDFAWKDGWNMYHGREVPGFPAHPHRGFETVTVVRKGRLDHADSLGAAARYGDGDVQWLTAGAGIQHAEMFPLLNQAEDNPMDLFQIWLNLPAKSKMVAPHFTMLWADQIPTHEHRDAQGRVSRTAIRAGKFRDKTAPSPPPHSWASDPENEVAIWTISMEPGAQLELPVTQKGIARTLYFFDGDQLKVGTRTLRVLSGAEVDGSRPLQLENGSVAGEVLILQGRPIAEPVARRGPFVMNTQAELQKAYSDYRQTRFGGWPWDSTAPVHGSDSARFARRDGKTERPG